MGRCGLDPAPQLKSELRMNPSPGLEPFPQVVLDLLGGDLRQSEIAEYRPQKLQRVHVLLVIAGASVWRFRAPRVADQFVSSAPLAANGQPALSVKDLGDSEKVLKNHPLLGENARALLKRGDIPVEGGWGGWLGRYQAALASAASEVVQNPNGIKDPRAKARSIARTLMIHPPKIERWRGVEPVSVAKNAYFAKSILPQKRTTGALRNKF
jgi:hypothetical protein